MKTLPRIYSPQIADIRHFQNVTDVNQKYLLSLSQDSIRILLDSVNRCDTKASAQVPFLLTLYGAYGVWVKGFLPGDVFLKCAFFGNTFLVCLALALTIACLWVRVYATFPPVANILEWIRNEPLETLNERLIPTILFKNAEAECQIYKSIAIKSLFLKASQLLILVITVAVLTSMLYTVQP